MRSKMIWINKNDRILLVVSQGAYRIKQMLELVERVARINPSYLIWDPSHMMFYHEQINDYNHSNALRQQGFDIMVDLLNYGRMRCFVTIKISNHPIFDVIKNIYHDLGVGSQIGFAPTVQYAATRLIEKIEQEKRINRNGGVSLFTVTDERGHI